MSKLTEPPPVRFFAGLIYSSDKILSDCIARLKTELGEIRHQSAEFKFSQTNYYEDEMGCDLKRKFLFFSTLVKREEIVEIKITCNKIENLFLSDKKRTVNIDPGYIAPEHLILATGKGYSHRAYLGKGVYADLTLIYRKNAFTELEWTYPDYKFKHIQDMFLDARKNYLKELKDKNII